MPVVNYLRACPLPKAKELLKECEKIDPAAVKRANSFFPTTPAASPAPAAEKASKIEFPGKSRPAVATYQSPIRGQFGDEVATASLPGAPPMAQPEVPADQAALFVNQGAAPAAALKHHGGTPPNLWLLLGVPWGVGLVLAGRPVVAAAGVAVVQYEELPAPGITHLRTESSPIRCLVSQLIRVCAFVGRYVDRH